MDAEHKPWYIAAIAVACCTFVITIFFNGFAASGIDLGLFQNNTGDISAVYYTGITPAGWTFSIWAFIYTWQGLFLAYSVSTIFRRSAYGYIYVNPGHQPPLIFVIYTVNLLCNIGWLFVWDRFFPQWALILILLTPITLIMCLVISHIKLNQLTQVLHQEDLDKDVWATRFLTQNGLAFYATWTFIASFVNLDVVIIYIGDYDLDLAGTICLTCILTSVIVYFFLDNFVIEKYLRYTFSPYIVLIVAIIGSLLENWDFTNNNSVLTAFLLTVILICTLLKIALFALRVRKHSIDSASDEVNRFLEESGKKDYGTVRYEPVEDV